MKLSNTLHLLGAGLLLSISSLAHAQGSRDGTAGIGVEVGEPVTPYSIDVDLSKLPTTPEWRPGDPIREAAKRQYYPLETKFPHAPASLLTSPDLLGDLQQMWDSQRGPGVELRESAPRINIDNGSTGVSPGDPVIEVSTTHVIYGINASTGTTFKIYNKSGTLLAGPTTFKSLAPAGDPCATSVSDPIIHYDRLADRWFMLEMGGTSSANRLCTYVSKTNNPVSGGWWFYGFATPALPDYPHCSVWHNAYVCTANESGTGAKVYGLVTALPATATVDFSRINSASISARRTTGIRFSSARSTSGLPRRIAVDVTTTAESPRFSALCPMWTSMPFLRSPSIT